ncbi:MAG: type II toxin-antitoxin system HipA family toxin [Brevundimonas sp.]|jgi:serine/threonine-protein kinase HipA|uniref:type II toxin-antitoxin system HipA family toxin n=1 Tax=Brevundimonas TaxID=41275 RepID=UPI000DAF5A5B|nr:MULTISPECIES: type II toxin-antitoxin system HipA family toxin [Brevundimonas]MBC1183273.1 type II toxin-antitoxin system HipA family toxin [Brevundimonas huaxiensis]PZU73808.1 MAG: type II toxin-antitoxin system HipA family toxin [Brevundimonas sp.]
MALHLVGETIDRARAHAAARSGNLVALVRGVYVDAADDVDAVIMAHAVRIAAYLYPRAYLSGASALLLAPTLDGRLFLSGRRNQRTRIRGLEIIQNQGPDAPSTVPAIVADAMGEIHMTASSPRQRFLEAFRIRSEHAGAIDPLMRRRMAERLIEEYGDARQAADAVWVLGRLIRWTREAEAAERFLDAAHPAQAPANAARVGLTVAWHGAPVGELTHDGVEWRWAATAKGQPPLVRPTRPGSLPPFIESLLPEGWLAEILDARDERELLRTGRRYMSNIAIVSDPAELAEVTPDVLQGRLAQHIDDGVFTGRYEGPTRRSLEESFQANLAKLFASRDTPRLSGIQIKAPMCLTTGGELIPSTGAPFTHILKPAGTNGFEDLPIVEWMGLALARAAGFETPDAALVPMPDGMRPALVVERFDIRRTDNDARRYALEDFCSILELPPLRKYEGSIERTARGLRPLSTQPAQDLEILYRRAVFAWLIADGDMHLKNLALLKIADPGSEHFDEVRFAPVYDAVTTRIFPGLDNDQMALTLNGKRDRLTPEDFQALARTIDLPVARAAQLTADCARRTVDGLQALPVPERIAPGADRIRDRISDIVRQRAEPFV